MLKRLAKVISWLFGGAFVLALAAYAVLVVANLDDRSPSAEVAAIELLQSSGSPLLSDRNSYLFMLGFAAAPDAEPLALGMERYKWMERASPDFDKSRDPLGEGYDFQALRSDAVAHVAAECSEVGAECFRILDSEEKTLEQWLASERWLLDRYRSLIGMTEFKEAMSLEVLVPLPAYSVVADLEGVRRAALLVAELRAAGVSSDEAVQRMLVSDKVDPYTNEPFTWVDGEEAILFQGLDPREGRSQHKFIF